VVLPTITQSGEKLGEAEDGDGSFKRKILEQKPHMKLASDQTLPSDLKAMVHLGDYARRFEEIVL
jgi:hypothetical protein